MGGMAAALPLSRHPAGRSSPAPGLAWPFKALSQHFPWDLSHGPSPTQGWAFPQCKPLQGQRWPEASAYSSCRPKNIILAKSIKT